MWGGQTIDYLGCDIGGAKELGVICFPTSWGAKEPQNLPKHRVVIWVVTTQICFIITPIPGEMIQFDEQIFEMGWNYQLGYPWKVHFNELTALNLGKDKQRLLYTYT